MKSKYFKEKQTRKRFQKFELKRRFLKCISRNQTISIKSRWIAQIELDRMRASICISKMKNYCLITNRVRSIDSKLKLSRIQLRNLILNRELPGITKSIW